MRYDWDPAKAASNLAKHGVAFDAVERFEWDRIVVRPSLVRSEPRLEVHGRIDGRLHVLGVSVETRTVRVISLRKSNKREEKAWESQS